MRNYMKKKEEKVETATLEKENSVSGVHFYMNKKKVLITMATIVLVLPIFFAIVAHKELSNVSLGEEGYIQLSVAPTATTSVKKSTISIPTGTVKANPFMPYRSFNEEPIALDVPEISLVAPPEAIDENSAAARVMDTIVSGILYDKFSPSAILNIEGNDYLVKKGDVVNNYKVISIMQDSVTVKLGSNTYKAGIGEILTEGSLNHNDVSNLSNKFGGVQ